MLWRGYALKNGTNPEAITYITDLFRKVSEDKSWLKFINNTSAQPVFLGHDKFTSMVNNDQQQAIKYLVKADILQQNIIPSSQKPFLAAGLLVLVFIVLLGLIYLFKRNWISSDTVIGTVLIFLSSYLYYLTLDFPVGKLAKTTGPASMPRLWIYGLLIFSIWLIIKSIRSSKQTETLAGRNISKALGLMGLMAAYILILDYLGYIISTFVFLISGTYLISYRKHLVIFLVTVGFIALSYLVFYKILQVSLPKGMIFQ